MISLNENERFSLISSDSLSSRNSLDSQLSIISSPLKSQVNSSEYNSKKTSEKLPLKKINCHEHLLFFCPLIFSLILLIFGSILFLIVGQRHNKHHKEENIRNQIDYPFNSTFNDSMTETLCSLNETLKNIHYSYEFHLAYEMMLCGLHRASILHIFYPNYAHPIHPLRSINLTNRISPPYIELNFDLLSKFNSDSFLLIFFDTWSPAVNSDHLAPHWIRYFSSFVEDGYDICQYVDVNKSRRPNQHKIVLLFTTNSSQMMITAKTICYIEPHRFLLSSYITFIKLELVAATHFKIYLENF